MFETSAVSFGKWRQSVAAIIINLSAVATGLTIGWTSPIIPQLQDADTPIGGEPMIQDQISWLTSIFCIAPLFILPLCSTLSERFGRKILGCLIAVPMGLSWLLTLVAKDFICLLVARILAGMGVAITLFIVPIYVAEIASDDVRGKLGSFLVFAINMGILLGFIFGVVMSYQIFAMCGILLAVVFVSSFVFMPETPIYLLRKGCTDQATRSLMWLRNNDKTIVDCELRRLQDIVKENSKSNKSVGFKDLWRDRGTFRGFLIALALLPGQQTCGIGFILTYTATIFRLAGSSLNPDSAAIIVAVIQVFGSLLSTMVIERVGRRSLLLISCMGMTISHSLLGSFFLFQSLNYDLTSLKWFPVTVLSFYTIFYCIGLGPVAFVVSSEVLSSDISGLASSVAIFSFWIIFFIIIKGFPIISDTIGNYGCFFIFASCCACTFLFTYFFIPETKGRAIESIVEELNGTSVRSNKSETNEDYSIKV